MIKIIILLFKKQSTELFHLSTCCLGSHGLLYLARSVLDYSWLTCYLQPQSIYVGNRYSMCVLWISVQCTYCHPHNPSPKWGFTINYCQFKLLYTLQFYRCNYVVTIVNNRSLQNKFLILILVYIIFLYNHLNS